MWSGGWTPGRWDGGDRRAAAQGGSVDAGGRLSGEGAPGEHRTAGSDRALRADGTLQKGAGSTT